MKKRSGVRIAVSSRGLDDRTSVQTAAIHEIGIQRRKGLFVVVDGPDGVGKGEMETALRRCEELEGKAVFDSIGWSKAYGDLPELKDFYGIPVPHYNTVMTAEPTFAGTGADIRNEVTFRNGREYSARIQMEMYANNRIIQMKRLVVPALAHGINILQSRCVAASLTYQVLKGMDEGLKLNHIKDEVLSH